jgi:mono/diheme cytochrome c family protein
MYTGLLHTHTAVVLLFVLLYLVKTALLLLGKAAALAKFSKATRVPEMIISAVFLITGLWMFFQLPEWNTLLLVKLAVVLVSIPLAIVGFKRANKGLAALAFLLIIGAYGLAEVSRARAAQKVDLAGAVPTDPTAGGYDALAHGKALYENGLKQAACVNCHGADGNLGLVGAKRLEASTKTDEELRTLLLNGKNAMPPYKKVFNDGEISALVAYVKSFRK